MDRNGIQKSILSCSTPGTFLVPGDVAAAVNLTRETNQYAADLKAKYPDRFGFWASLPLPDIEASLAEIDYAMDKQKADGVMLLSNHQGLYLGDPALQPILEKLNRRRIAVFVHPTVPCNKNDKISGPPNEVVLKSAPLMDAYLAPMLEYMFDSTRSFVDLLLSGTVFTYPSISWIVTHCGVALPSLLDRAIRLSNYNLSSFGTFPARQVKPITANQIRTLFATQFFFDTAGGTCMPNDIPDLLRWVEPDRLMYGSDVPWTDINGNDTLSLRARIQAASLTASSPENIRKIFGDTARKLLRLERTK